MSIDYNHWDLSPEEIVFLILLFLSGGMVIGWLFYDSLSIGLPLGISCFLLIPRYRRWKAECRKRELLLQFRDVLYSVASSVSTGRNLAQALEESISFWEGTYGRDAMMMKELDAMVHKIRESNTSDTEVLQDFARRSGLDEVADFAGVYESCKGSGANLIQAVNRAAMVIGDKITLEKELHTLMAQKRFESRVVMCAPFGLLFLLKIFSPEYLMPLTESQEGRMISSLALLLIGLACLMMERVNRFDF